MSYKFYNPNPNQRFRKDGTPMKWHGTDCTVRSLAKVKEWSWKEAYKYLFEVGYDLSMTFDDMAVLRKAYARLGGEKLEQHKGDYIPTVKEFAKSHKKGTYIASLAGHVVCIKDGNWYDTWDCGNYKVRSAYKF